MQSPCEPALRNVSRSRSEPPPLSPNVLECRSGMRYIQLPGCNLLTVRRPEKRYAPPDVQRLIDLANSIPPDCELPSPENMEQFLRVLRRRKFSRFRQLTGPVKKDDYGYLPTIFRKNHRKTFNTVLDNFYLFRETLNWLNHIESLQTSPGGIRMMPATSNSSVPSAYLDHRGQVRFEIGPIIRALDGVEAARIRRCPICGLFFWASRKDKPGCGPRCANTLRARRWRHEYKGRYKVSRIRRAEQKDKA